MAQRYPVPALNRFLALSTVSVGCGPDGGTPMLASIAIVDYRGQSIFASYVLPTNQVTDYRTGYTGIEASTFEPGGNALPWKEVQQKVAELIRDHILVGYALWNDLSVLGLPHPAVATRDVALYWPFRNALRCKNMVGLQTLTWRLMCHKIQQTHVCALENARAALDLYRSHREDWEYAVSRAQWPCQLPPPTFSGCFI